MAKDEKKDQKAKDQKVKDESVKEEPVAVKELEFKLEDLDDEKAQLTIVKADKTYALVLARVK